MSIYKVFLVSYGEIEVEAPDMARACRVALECSDEATWDHQVEQVICLDPPPPPEKVWDGCHWEYPKP